LCRDQRSAASSIVPSFPSSTWECLLHHAKFHFATTGAQRPHSVRSTLPIGRGVEESREDIALRAKAGFVAGE